MNGAAEALALWPLHARTVALFARRENEVHRVEAEEGVFALRLHRRGFRSQAELSSELDWMAELARQGVAVPRPAVSRTGRLIETLDGQLVSVLSWLPGEPLGVSGAPLSRPDPVRDFDALGRSLAALHLVSDQWTPPEGFERWRWDADGLVGERPLWGRFWDAAGLEEETRGVFARVRARAAVFFRGEGGSLDFGLIHADAVRENVLMSGGAACLIDFDDAGWGFRLFDIATALVKNIDETDYDLLEASLLRGYHALRPLDVSALPLMLALRALTYVGWIADRMGESGAVRRRERMISAALRLARRLDA